MSSEEDQFCMIVMGKKDGKFQIFPMLSSKCHCNNLETKHFQLYAKYTENKDGIIPTNEEDIKSFEEYCKKLNI